MRIVGGINLYRNLHRSLRTTAGLPLSRARDVRTVTPVDSVDEREPHFINTVGRHRAQRESLSRRAWWTKRLGTEPASARRFTALDVPLAGASTRLRLRQYQVASDSVDNLMGKMLELARHCQVQMSDELLVKYTQATLQGPVLHPDVVAGKVVLPLHEQVQFWSPTSAKTERDMWVETSNALEGKNFSKLLGRLRATGEFTDPRVAADLRRRVGRLLGQLGKNKPLREVCFGLASDALTQGDDRVALSLINMEQACAKWNNHEMLPVEVNLADLTAWSQKFKSHDLSQDDALMTFLSTWQPMNGLLSSQDPARFKRLEATIATQVKVEKKRIQEKQAELFEQSPPDFVEQSNQLMRQYHSAPETIATRVKAHWIAQLMASTA
jgi:hypothetical protein